MKRNRSLLLALTAAVQLWGCEAAFHESADPVQDTLDELVGQPRRTLDAQLLGSFQTGIFDDGAAEIVAFDPGSTSLFVVNGSLVSLDIIDIADPTTPQLRGQIDLTPFGDDATSVDVSSGLVAAAIPASPATSPGQVVFFDTAGNFLNSVTVGALPDMVTFTPDGTKLLVANEGEPSDDYLIDPEGSVSIIDLTQPITSLSAANVTEVSFATFNNEGAIDPGVRIFGPGASVAQDLEPEYIAVSGDSATAWVSLQENNAVAIIDIASGQVSDIVPLGVKDHTRLFNSFDASDKDDAIRLQPWPVLGMYQPDALAYFEVRGRSYLISANEGASRDLDGFSEEVRVEDLVLDPNSFPDQVSLQAQENLGRLVVSSVNGDVDGDGDFDQIYSFGARSIAVWSADDVSLVSDSGFLMEGVTARVFPSDFNSNDDENGSFDSRSDNKGPEPVGVITEEVFGTQYAFVALERIGGVMAFDLTLPSFPIPTFYVNNRNFAGIAADGSAGDLAPEGLKVITPEKSPTGTPLLVVSNEVSGTTSIFELLKKTR